MYTVENIATGTVGYISAPGTGRAFDVLLGDTIAEDVVSAVHEAETYIILRTPGLVTNDLDGTLCFFAEAVIKPNADD